MRKIAPNISVDMLPRMSKYCGKMTEDAQWLADGILALLVPSLATDPRKRRYRFVK